jgi:hypothetical protein
MSAKKERQRRAIPVSTEPRAPLPWSQFIDRHSQAIALILILFASVRIIATYTIFNHTSDEPAHIACGMEWLDKKVYTWEPQHPPLARIAVAAGPYLLGIRSQNTPRTDLVSMTREGLNILYSGHRYDLTLALARLGILPFFWVACLVVYEWGTRFFSRTVAAAAVFLFSFLPPILAHAALATTDMALVAFLGAAFVSGLIWIEHPSRLHAVLFGSCTGFAVLSKFSTLAFFPAIVALALAWYFVAERPPLRQLASAAGERIPTFCLAVLVASLELWAAYRFSWGKVDFANIHLPAPEFYRGVQDVLKHNAEGHPGYVLGHIGTKGFWYFYPVVLAVKTPLAFLLLLGIGTALVFRRPALFRRAWIPLAFAIAILLVGLTASINIGVRHILPIYMALSLLAAAAAVRMMEQAGGRRWILITLACLLLWFAGSSLLSHPDYLAYFNELAGSEPEKILVDSDLDWGQDAKRLAVRLQELGVRELTFAYFAQADYEREHGFPHLLTQLDVMNPSPGWYAVSLTALRERRLGLYSSNPNLELWPDRIKPLEKVGKSILLWHFLPAASPR